MANNANNAGNQPEGFDVYLTTRHWVRVINVVNDRIVAIDRAMYDGTMTPAMDSERALLRDSLIEIDVAAHETGIYRLVYGVTGEDDYNHGSNIGNNNGANGNGANGNGANGNGANGNGANGNGANGNGANGNGANGNGANGNGANGNGANAAPAVVLNEASRIVNSSGQSSTNTSRRKNRKNNRKNRKTRRA